ncbi:MAG: hypothetical protein ACUVQP_10495 [Bacteroidales bacterium]
MASATEILLLTDYIKKISSDFSLNNRMVILYEGEVNHEIINSILHTLDSYFKKANIPRQTQKSF